MKQSIYKLFNYFHSKTKLQTTNHVELAVIRNKESLVIGFSFVSCLMVLMMFMALYFSPRMTPHISIFLLLILAAVYSSLPFILKYTGKIAFSANIGISATLVAIILRAVTTGGINSSAILWVFLLPWLGSLVSKRTSIIWLVNCTLSVLFVLYADGFGVSSNEAMTSPEIKTFIMILILIQIVAISLIHQVQKDRQLDEILRGEEIIARNERLILLGKTSGGLAHEMNNPLAIIKGNLDIIDYLKESQELSDEVLSDKMTIVKKNLSRVQGVIDSMRTFTHDDYMSNFKTVDLAEQIQNCFDNKNEEYHNEKFELINSVPEKKYKISVDQGLIERVFSGLIDNAMTATQASSESWIRFEVIDDDENFITLGVTDSGDGISPKIEARIFEPFFTTRPIGEASGLGLSLAFNIMNMHKGHIEYNKSSMHTQFLLRFPKNIKT